MSKIEKLSIMGVRSFGPMHPEVISFNTPLTLIVGFNGSGKTTIIECLKYSTTGELPPNSKGGAFIHDPNLVGENVVKAQVKLAFRSTLDESFVVTRSTQLTVKKNSRTQKTLDGTLKLLRNGERSVMSSKNAELDRLVPETLGVSQAVLDAVIFCHQDESLWPMSEPAALKKKFDEIFEALRYTKAVDNLKVIRKKQGEQLRQYKVLEEQFRQNKERGERTEKQATALQTEIEEMRIRCGELDEEYKSIQEQVKEKYEQANSYGGIVKDLQVKSQEGKYKQEVIEQLRGRIEMMDESDEYLTNAFDQYEERIARITEDRDQKAQQYRELEAELKSVHEAHNAKVQEQGKLQSDKDKYERQVVNRKKMIQDAAARHEIWGYDGDLDDRQVQTFNDRIQKVLDDKKRELERLQRDNAEKSEEAAAGIAKLENRKSSHSQNRDSARSRIAAIEKRISNLQQRIFSLDVDENSITELQLKMKDLEARYEKAIADEKEADFDRVIQQENDHLRQLESELDRLNLELLECGQFASDRAQLDLRKKEQTERKRNLDLVTSTWMEKLSTVLGVQWRPETIESEHQAVLRQQDSLVADARKLRDSTQQELKQLDYKLSAAHEQHKMQSEKRNRAKLSVTEALEKVKNEAVGVDQFETELEELGRDLKQVDTDIQLYDELKKFYQRAEKTASRFNKCHLCDRDFKDNLPAKSKLLEKIAKNLNDAAKQELLDDKVDFEEKLATLRAVGPGYALYVRIGNELPGLDKAIKEMDAQKETLIRQLEDRDAVFKEVDEKRQELESLTKTVMKIAQLHREISESEEEIQRLTMQQSSTTLVRSAEEVRELQASCNAEVKKAQSKVNRLINEKQRTRQEVMGLGLERSEQKNKIGQASQQLEQKKALQDQVQEMKDELAAQRDVIQQADREIAALEPQILKARALREDAVKQGRVREQKASEERDSISKTDHQLKLADAEIRDYIDRGGPANLAANQRAVASLEKTIGGLEKDKAALTVQVNGLSKEIDNSDRKKQNIRENLEYRKLQRDLDQIRRDILELRSRNAQEDYDRLLAEAQALEEHRNRLSGERQKTLGAMMTKDQSLAQLLDTYAVEYQNAQQDYQKAHINVETSKAAIEDLGNYAQALDTAIMQYHTLKMAEVNRIAAELWQGTYQGTDIDTILIRSDAEAASTAAAAQGRRSYNYRVCMVKGTTEMDMRGRCSAGQKVLASIIIRLALAESFGVNCGLIALDEPTTNLDSDNIRSLAESLHAIIKARQAQSNFQLIVITHDEEFLKHMQCSDFCDDFYRVRRDENQNSVIVRENITKVMEG